MAFGALNGPKNYRRNLSGRKYGYGRKLWVDKVRFPNATHSGAFRGRVSLLESNEIPGGVKYKVKIVFEIKGEDKPACVAEFLVIAYAGPGKNSKLLWQKQPKKRLHRTVFYTRNKALLG